MSRFLKVLGVVAVVYCGPAMADKLGLGRAALVAEITAWDIDVRPDGMGLPEGRGNVEDGEEIFAEKCASCHGDFGEGVGRWPVLAGGADSLQDARPVKTIGSYWPYLSTVWDYVHRAMPFGEAQSLPDDEVYAIVAYLMYVNDLVEDDFELSRANLAAQKMPNEANFMADDRADTGGEIEVFTRTVCMEACKPSVEITGRALAVDVTPTGASETGETDEETGPETAVTPVIEAVVEPAALDAGLVAAGVKVFRKCKSCHQVGEGAKNRTGPILNDIWGRELGAVAGYKYSKAMKAAAVDGQIWDEAALTAFLTKPKAYLPKTKMSFSGLKKEKDIAAMLEYLKSVSR